MALTDSIDIYCERLDPSFWAEPLNAVSNAAFILAALWGFSRARKAGGSLDKWVFGLSALIAVIGIGSFLFHTYANKWSEIADVLPITVFIYSAFFAIMRRLFGISLQQALAATGLFFGGTLVIEPVLAPTLGGSAAYAPALIAIAGVGMLGLRHNAAAAKLMLITAAVFALSLTLRTLDMPLCGSIPSGLHYFWHGLNAVTLALIIEALRATQK